MTSTPEPAEPAGVVPDRSLPVPSTLIPPLPTASAVSPPPLPTIGLDDVVHQRVRLGVLTLLADGSTIEFAVLRNTLDLTDGNLARHLSVLERAGFVTRRRSDANGGRTRTWMDITPAGRAALAAEIAALRRLIAHLDRVGPPHDDERAGPTPAP